MIGVPMADRYADRRIYLPAESPWRGLGLRLLAILVLTAVVWLLLWTQRDGIKDNRDGSLSPLDLLYFAVVTITTVGYGDIVPISNWATGIVTFAITPIRVVIWLVFLTTAYDLLLRRSIESIHLNRLRKSMKGHTIICGFGVKGRSAAEELLSRGVPPNHILVVERDPDALEAAANMGLTALRGDATRERHLLDAGVRGAANVIVAPNSDSDCVLMCLTARDLNPSVTIVAAAREDENVRLVERSGANVVIAPSVAGGRLLAASTDSPASASFLGELLDHGRGAEIEDYRVRGEDVGRSAREVADGQGAVALSLRRGTDRFAFLRAQTMALQAGDVLILLRPAPEAK